MPILEIDFTYPSGVYAVERLTFCQLMSYMAWPADNAQDKERRTQYVAGEVSKIKEKIDSLNLVQTFPYAANEDEAVLELTEKNIIDAVIYQARLRGALDAVLREAPSRETLQKERDHNVFGGEVAAAILMAIVRMDTHGCDHPGGASVKKAISLVENVYLSAECGLAKSASSLKKFWSLYKPVVHFYAAGHTWAGTVDGDVVFTGGGCDPTSEQGLKRFLAVAQWFQDFATAFVPNATDSPLIPLDVFWTIPPDLVLPKIEYVLPPLFQEERNIIGEYNAPAAY